MTNFHKDKQQITNWLDKYEVKNYTLIPDEQYGFIVDVNGDVDLSSKKLINITVKFNEIKGNFDCSNNKLTSLEFCPQTVSSDFNSSYNKLTSIEFCPQEVGRDFSCSNNKLTSLEFCSQKVSRKFYCNNNQLKSLEFSPQSVGGKFHCNGNPELEEIQKITDFNLIYLEHKKISTKKLAEKLNNDLQSDSSKKMTRIKI